MKRIKALHGYTIYEATQRDKQRDASLTYDYYIYFSSDIRDYGLTYSYAEYETDSLEDAEAFCLGDEDFAIIREELEQEQTLVSYEDIEAEQKRRAKAKAKQEAEAIAKTQELEAELIQRDADNKALADFAYWRALCKFDDLIGEERRYCARYCELNPEDRERRERDRDLIILAYQRAQSEIRDIFVEALKKHN